MIDCLRVSGASHLATSLIPPFLERISVLTKPPPCLGSPQSDGVVSRTLFSGVLI